LPDGSGICPLLCSDVALVAHTYEAQARAM
jgi:hypothetical protein